jgi:hypothetical protein
MSRTLRTPSTPGHRRLARLLPRLRGAAGLIDHRIAGDRGA